MTEEAIRDRLRRTGLRISRATVYNALLDLSDAGLTLRADVGPGRAVYEVETAWHHHFVCRRCGSVRDVECIIGRKPCLKPAGNPGLVDEAQVIFRGLCTRCGKPGLSPAVQ